VKKHKHHWLSLGYDHNSDGEIQMAGAWYWCPICGATKHVIYDRKFFGLDANGVYIRHVGEDKKVRLCRKWRDK